MQKIMSILLITKHVLFLLRSVGIVMGDGSDTHLFARRWWPVCGSESPLWQFKETASGRTDKRDIISL